MVLVLTNPCDEVADKVIGKLRERGARVARFDPAELPQRSTVTMGAGTNGMGTEIYRSWGPSIDLDEVRSVWYRRPGDFVIPPYQRPQTTQFARSELSAALSGILRALDCYWMNHPAAIAGASYKAEQLVRAARFGLPVPATCITSQPAHARAFFREHDGHVIIKVLADSDIYSPEEGGGFIGNIFTSSMSADALDKLDRVRDAPVLLQELVQKRFDIRVTIVQDTVFAAAIDSQGSVASRVDWRQSGLSLPHHVIELPHTIRGQLVALTHSYGLTFACVDLVLCPDDKYAFLELNPIGEWGWLERMTDLRITDSIVAALLTRSPVAASDQRDILTGEATSASP